MRQKLVYALVFCSFGAIFYLIGSLYWELITKAPLMKEAFKEQIFEFKVEGKSIDSYNKDSYVLHLLYNDRFVVKYDVDFQTYTDSKVGSNVYIKTSREKLYLANQSINRGYIIKDNIIVLKLVSIVFLLSFSLFFTDYKCGDHITTFSHSDIRAQKPIHKIFAFLFKIGLILFISLCLSPLLIVFDII